VGVALALFGSAGVTQAAPGSDATIDATSFQLNTGAADDAVAECPAGRRATGGGIGTTGPIGSDFYQVGGSGPLDETGLVPNTGDGDLARSWYAAVTNDQGSQQTFKTLGICSQSSDATIRATSAFVFDNDVGDATVSCPEGQRAVGGGVISFGSISFESYTVQVSGPLDASGLTANTNDGDVARSWYSAVSNDSGGGVAFTFFALCSAGSDAVVEATPFSKSLGFAGAAASCPTGRRALGGGVGSETAVTGDSYEVITSGPRDETGLTASTDDGDVAKSWYAAVKNTLVAPTAFKTFAICTVDARCAGSEATAIGTDGPDTLRGTAGRDVIAGFGGRDVIRGLKGGDRLCGGAGRDRLLGGAGRDVLLGQAGRDRLLGGPGRDKLKGGPGRDRQRQ
jgi:Ca2+-binding RTX toxin-like protein